jgi:hypothetical protein
MRIDPYTKVFRADAPLATHWRYGTCEEAECEAHAHGWLTRVDETTELGQAQAAYIRRDHTRQYTETIVTEGLTTFRFAAGQQCYQEHRVPLERAPVLRVATVNEVRTHTRMADWWDDMHTHTDNVSRG